MRKPVGSALNVVLDESAGVVQGCWSMGKAFNDQGIAEAFEMGEIAKGWS